MSCHADTRAVLRRAGRRATTPRVQVACALRHAGGHRSAAAIHARVREEHGGDAPALSTVYRTLDALREMRLVSEVDDGSGAAYQWLNADERHHHLVCGRCGAGHDLDGALFERLRAAIHDETGFEAFLDHFVIAGLCRACAQAAPAGGARP